MVQENLMQVHFDAKSVNEGLARMVVTAFMTNMNPTLEQIADVKKAWKKSGHKIGEIKTMDLYNKPEESKVYYVIYETESGSVEF